MRIGCTYRMSPCYSKQCTQNSSLVHAKKKNNNSGHVTSSLLYYDVYNHYIMNPYILQRYYTYGILVHTTPSVNKTIYEH